MTFPALPSRTVRLTLCMAASLAALGWFALSVEGTISFRGSFRSGLGLAEALFRFLRFFTILTNLFVAGLMTVTVWRLVRPGRAPPAATLYAAALVYALVVGTTYEMILRDLWSPKGIQFVTDMVMHDVVPVLTLVFWLACAPKAPLGLGDPARWLAFPAAYFAVTLLAGLGGEGYPYGFLDAGKLGYGVVMRNAVAFLALFFGLGVGTVIMARALDRGSAGSREYSKR